ncbi:CARDB domain-containing protein [Natronorubrum thiooxidans]|uniref:CARDB protein n=1 Tax=Natronorubrum thiooxidans TaxID=308853 RepID=A0A1N7EJS2_9EURY|nr:CARDB domain-containing protein [Natronorubrum thiooxidans]SIR88362.1 CARDB protein [Natronorubrum thiooxidans]
MERRTLITAGVGVGLAGCINMNQNETGNGNDSSDDGDAGTDPPVDNGEATVGNSGRDVTFHSCSRATVTGTFDAGDVAFASTDFYDEGLYGNTILENGVVFGEDVDAPFSGTVVFEITGDSNVREGTDEIGIEVPAYGSDGTVISSLTTRQADYQRVSATHGNPHASDCLEEISPADGGDTTFVIDSLETNTPIDAGQYLEVRADVRNTGDAAGTQSVELVVGNDPERVEVQPVTLDPGAQTTVSMGYVTPRVENDQAFPVRVRSAGDSDERSVTVYGTDGDGRAEAHFDVGPLETNTPVDAGQYLEVRADVRNTGDAAGSRDVRLVVGNDPEQVDVRSVALEPGTWTTVTMGYTTPRVENDQEFPVGIESGDDSTTESVLVYGMG